MSATPDRLASALAAAFPGPLGGRYLRQVAGREGWSDEELSPVTFRRHVEGLERIGRSFDPARLAWASFDVDGKRHPEGRAWALATAQRIAQALADLGIPTLLEQSRSGQGFHVWLLFDGNGPSLDEARELAAAVLRVLDLPDTFTERPGAPGFYPWHPRGKECGRVPYLPLHGACNGSPSGLLCDLTTGEPFADQLAALESAPRIARETFDEARSILATVAPKPAQPERPTLQPRPFSGELTRYAEAALRGIMEQVTSAPEGERHDAVYVAARCGGELIAGGELPRSLVEGEVRNAAAAVGLLPNRALEVERAIADGIEKGLTNPRHGDVNCDAGAAPEEPPHIYAADDPFAPMTEAERASALRAEYARQAAEEEPVPAEPVQSEPAEGVDLPADCWRPGFRDFRDAYANTTEAAGAFFYGGYLVAAGLMVGRNASLRCGVRVHPAFYVVNLGETGLSRKSEAQDKAGEAIRFADESVLSVPAIGSAEGLLEIMADGESPLSAGRRVLLDVAEFSALLLKASSEATRSLGPMLTRLWDCPPEYALPKAGQKRKVSNPFLCIHTSSTVEWFQRDMTEDLLRGGLANRPLYFMGPTRPPIAFPPPPDDYALGRALDALRGARDRHGVLREYALSPAAEGLYTDWYNAMRAKPEESPVLGVLSHRLHANAWRAALVYAAMEDSGEVSADQMSAALALADYQRAVHRVAFEGWGDSEAVKLEERIKRVLKQGPIPEWRLQQRVRKVDAETLHRRVQALARVGRIRERREGRRTVLELCECKEFKGSARKGARG